MIEKQEVRMPYKPMAYEELTVHGILHEVYGLSKEEATLTVERHRAIRQREERLLEKILRAWA